jgi:spermidine synthase
MKSLVAQIKPFLWFLYPKHTLFEGPGLYSKIKVTQQGSRVNLYTGENDYIQTTMDPFVKPSGTHLDWFLAAPWFAGKFNGNINSLLILGMAGGAQVKAFNKYYNVKSVTAVEIDPLIIEIAKKYFQLNDKNLTIVNKDAVDFVAKDNGNYDVVIVDVFKENIVEGNCTSEDFFIGLQGLLAPDGVLFINKLAEDRSNDKMGIVLKKLFATVFTLQVRHTKYFVSTNSVSAPKNVRGVEIVFKKASVMCPDLKFFAKERACELVASKTT